MSVDIIIGTRPELIKMAPIAIELQRRNIPHAIVNTAQHQDLLNPLWKAFQLQPDVSLDLMVPGQSLSSLTARAINQLDSYIEGLKVKPSIILAQGDTTTVLAAAMVSFYNKLVFGHVEAGLRSRDLMNPFPEEFNRKVVSITTDLHFAPTRTAMQNLAIEGISASKIHVVGNTVVDSLNIIRETAPFKDGHFIDPRLAAIDFSSSVLITCHRRENHGKNLTQIIAATKIIANEYPETNFLWSLHPNPNILSAVKSSDLTSLSNFILLPPLEYFDLLKIVSRCTAIITDSGGIQEEAPSFGKPVIVLREVTERPEAVELNMAKLVGADISRIVQAFQWALSYDCHMRDNPYGDGKSAAKIVDILEVQYGLHRSASPGKNYKLV